MKTLGKYELLDEIASGGMGRIYRARDRVLHREVAIKTIFTGETDPEIKQRFYREARACAALSHPNIVTVFDLGEQQGTSYIAMESLAGEDLRRFIDRRGSMTLEAKIDFMAQVCEGLAHAHENRIVHRDLKPGNIFILKSGRPKLLDFGVARIAASRLTQPGTPLGTPRYMAPEQLLGKEADVLSDLFSLAMVFFEFLTGTHPFDGEDVSSKILHEPPRTILALNPNFPERLDKVFSKALSKEPGARFQNAGILAKELRKVTVDMVSECSRLWNEVLNHRKRILELESAAGDFLRTAWIQTELKKSGIDLGVVEKIKAESSATVVSELHFLDLISFLEEIKRIEMVLTRISDDSIKARQDAEEADLKLQKGDTEAASRIVCPLEERFPDHPVIAALGREIRLRSRAKVLEEALASENLVDALEVLNDLESIESSNPESIALVKGLRSRVDDAMAAKDLLCDSTKATLKQLQSSLSGDDALKVEKMASSLAELSQELIRRFAGRKVPKDIGELVASCEKVQGDAKFHVARIRVREALNAGDLASVRASLRTAREIGQGDPNYEGWLARIQKEVFDSILCGEAPSPLPAAAQATPPEPPSIEKAPPEEKGIAQLETRPQERQASETMVPVSWEGAATMVPTSLEAAATMILPAVDVAATMVSTVPQGGEFAVANEKAGQIDQKPLGVRDSGLRTCAVCGASSPAGVTRCRLCDAPMPDASALKPGLKSSEGAKGKLAGWTKIARDSVANRSRSLRRATRTLAARFRALPKKMQLAAISAAVVLVVLIAASVVALSSGGSVRSGPVVGRARILAESALLRESAGEDASVTGRLSRGTPVEILDKIPSKSLSSWALVRSTDKKPASGFVRLSELAAAETGVGDFDMWHARSLMPDPARADAAELRARLADAETTVARFLKGSESVNLHLQIAAAHTQLAKRALPDRAAAKSEADRAQAFLDQLRNWGAVPAESGILRASLDEIARVPEAASRSKSAGQEASLNRELDRAQRDFDAGDFTKAMSRCEKILSSDKSNQEASSLLKKAAAARQAKGKSSP